MTKQIKFRIEYLKFSFILIYKVIYYLPKGQLQNPSTCACACSPGFSGTLCQYFDCTSTIQDAPECVILTCSDPTEVVSCPRQCSAPCASASTSITSTATITVSTTSPGTTTTGTTTTVSTTTTTVLQTCAPLACSYGQLQNSATCACTCLAGFSGTLCENFDCASTIQDAPECVILTCADPTEIASCPRQCSAPCA